MISEGFRLSHGTVTRLPRILRDEELVYKEWTIPAGTPVSSNSFFVEMDFKIFPEPTKFDPERWLKQNGVRDATLEKYLVNFGRGSRMCLGMK